MCLLNVTHCKHPPRLRSLSQCGVDITTMEDRTVYDRCPRTLHVKPLTLEQSHASNRRYRVTGEVLQTSSCVVYSQEGVCPIYYIVTIIIVNNSMHYVLNTHIFAEPRICDYRAVSCPCLHIETVDPRLIHAV